MVCETFAPPALPTSTEQWFCVDPSPDVRFVGGFEPPDTPDTAVSAVLYQTPLAGTHSSDVVWLKNSCAPSTGGPASAVAPYRYPVSPGEPAVPLPTSAVSSEPIRSSW